MFKLSSIIIALLLSFNTLAKSPHGDKLSIKCDVCHNPESWTFKIKNNSFDHTQTKFSLDGRHKTVDCRKCHSDLIFSNAKTTCISCHKDMHQQTAGQDCERCHTSRSWLVTNITEIHRQSRFPLNGQHTQTDCYQCHKSASLLRFDPMGIECANCHSKEYIAATKPSHIASKFPRDCFLCHNEMGWQPAKFDHNANTLFPLKDGHYGVDCNKCHSNGYTATSTVCVSCHQNNYNATINPGHIAAKFSTDCKICHTVTAWSPATFNHTTGTTFPLTGAHIGATCISCHSKGYVGISTACVSCHLTNYNASTNPAHAAAKFPTTCETCHTSTAWAPSTFNHDSQYFRIYSGKHKSRWTLCSECHTSATNYAVFSCLLCHEHNKTSMDSEHKGKTGYVYNSTNCLSCHPGI